MRALRVEFDDAVLDRFHGAPSGEHGIGRLRAETLPRGWGREGYEGMRATKKAFDPQGLLNPGVLFSDAPWWASWGELESRKPMLGVGGQPLRPAGSTFHHAESV